MRTQVNCLHQAAIDHCPMSFILLEDSVLEAEGFLLMLIKAINTHRG